MGDIRWRVGSRADGYCLVVTGMTRAETLVVLDAVFGREAVEEAAATLGPEPEEVPRPSGPDGPRDR